MFPAFWFQVAGLFKDESLEYSIDVVVTRTVMFEDNRVRYIHSRIIDIHFF